MKPAGAVPRVPFEAIPEAVMLGLTRKGKTIDMIEKASKYKGDASQQKFRNKQAWHSKPELDRFVADTLKLDIPSVLGPKRVTSEFSSAISSEISKLRKKGTILDWQGDKRIGVWRLAKTPQKPTGDLKMSMKGDIPTQDSPQYDNETGTVSEEDMRRAFVSILSRGAKDNTYKFALARAILEYCHKKPAAGNDFVYEIPYEYLAGRFLRYYWRQECLFKIKQDFHKKRTPKVVQAIQEVFDSSTPGSFSKLKNTDIQRAEKMILRDVFGHARSKTSLVVPKFQKIKVGQRATYTPIFYDYDDGEKMIYIKPDAFEFFNRNYQVLLRVVLAEWTRFLERVNTMPRLMTKLGNTEMRRSAMKNYREPLERHFDHCFYCCDRLEAEYTDVDHFIPWSYIFEDSLWNLVLACRDCNCKKSASLAEEEFLNSLIERNTRYSNRIEMLRSSLYDLSRSDGGWRQGISNHYHTCRDYGFTAISLP